MAEPPPKKIKADGNLGLVDQSILAAARDPAKWIEARRRNWPSKARIAEKQAAQKSQFSENSQVAENSQVSGQLPDTGNSDQKNSEPKIPVCRFFLRGKCFAGDKCRYRHERNERPKKPSHERVYKRFEAPPANSLFVKLVQTDQQTEDTRFIRFLEFLHRKNRL